MAQLLPGVNRTAIPGDFNDSGWCAVPLLEWPFTNTPTQAFEVCGSFFLARP